MIKTGCYVSFGQLDFSGCLVPQLATYNFTITFFWPFLPMLTQTVLSSGQLLPSINFYDSCIPIKNIPIVRDNIVLVQNVDIYI